MAPHDDIPAASRPLKLTTSLDERPREKAKAKGFAALTTAELLAIILGSGSPGESVVELCQRMLHDHQGKLYNLARRSVKDLMNGYRGIGEVKAIEILAALELARRYQQEEFDERFKITSSDDAYKYLRTRMEHLDHEEIMVVLLNHAKQVEECVRISSGGTAMTVADIKMILRPAIERLSSGIILAHNHPSDNPKPSAQDDRLTERVHEACKVMDIQLVDHIIVCRGGHYYSYADHGCLM